MKRFSIFDLRFAICGRVGVGCAIAVLCAIAAQRIGAAEKTGTLRRPTPPGTRSAAPAPVKTPAETNTVEAITAAARASMVVITQFGRDAKEEGVGAGFVISEDGLVATSLHVIGEARAVRVRLASGRTVEVKAVHASDRTLDLAILRVAAEGLRPLRLGDSDKLAQGAQVIAIGNPLGLEHSVVQGVLSARREFDGLEMLQVAIPIEPGNSGGPLLDMKGRVHGILTLKSAMTRNLGFAMPINRLKSLIERPNPIPIERWLTIGALNSREWTTPLGAHWTQRAGRLLVDGAGRGFGGRALCLSKSPAPPRPFELAVQVKLDDEAGAAGLVFGSDGEDRHYGFYPTGGQLRLTQFDGPDVFSWKILRQIGTPHYRRETWNQLRVRVEAEVVRCYVNEELVCEAPVAELAGTAVGLAKFRDTQAEFRGFQVSTNFLASGVGHSLPPELAGRIARGDDVNDALADALRPHADAARTELRERARRLEQQAASLRQLASRLHRDSVRSNLVSTLAGPEAGIDLFQASLLVARYDDPDLDVDAYRRQRDDLARELTQSLPAGADNETKLKSLRAFLFDQHGFHGSRTDYYNRANSYINQVLDDREGLPITLSILFLELARAIGIEGLAGAPLPGHFMVRYTPRDGPVQLIDVFDGGKIITRGEAQERVFDATGEGFREEHLQPASKRDIVVRMLRNLQATSERSGSPNDALHYADLLVAVSPEPGERLARVRLRLQRGDRSGAGEDLQWLLDANPPGLDRDRVAEFLESLKSEEGR